MSTRASAARYARALFDVATKESDPSAIEQDLASINGLITTHSDLQMALESRGVPPVAKRGVVQALVDRGQFTAPVAKLLVMLAERDRLALLPDVLDVYREHLREQQRVLQAEVTTATELTAEQQQALQERLSAATSRHVTITTKVDPALIGGVVAQIGSTVYDGSLATQLEKLKARLAL